MQQLPLSTKDPLKKKILLKIFANMPKCPPLKAKFTRIQNKDSADEETAEPKKAKYSYKLMNEGKHQEQSAALSPAPSTSSSAAASAPHQQNGDFPVTKYEELDQPGPSSGNRTPGHYLINSNCERKESPHSSDNEDQNVGVKYIGGAYQAIKMKPQDIAKPLAAAEEKAPPPIVSPPSKHKAKNPNQLLFVQFTFNYTNGQPYIFVYTCKGFLKMPHADFGGSLHIIDNPEMFHKYTDIKNNPLLPVTVKTRILMRILQSDEQFKALYDGIQTAFLQAFKQNATYSNTHLGGA